MRAGGASDDVAIGIPAAAEALLSDDAPYLVEGLPYEFHCHGMGSSDFSDFMALDLLELEATARSEGVLCIPTLYLPRPRLDDFVGFMRYFASMRERIPHIAGIALEGPMLASFGGTPERGVWLPDKREWDTLLSLAPYGLAYMILSPDAFRPGSHLAEASVGRDVPDLRWIVERMIDAGVRPGLGHFHRKDPAGSAEAVAEVVEIVKDLGVRPGSSSVVTDHLFNDMPLNFRHSWRTKADRERRDLELSQARLDEWSMDNLAEVVGPVPAALMRAGRDGYLTICLNFDGEHVDHAIAHRAVQLVGSQSFIVMTDRSDVPWLGGQKLTKGEDNGLWYQGRGIVAAGSTPIDVQIKTLRRLGFSEPDIWTMTAFNARAALSHTRSADDACSLVWADGTRTIAAPAAVGL